jgi:hypothetical protein
VLERGVPFRFEARGASMAPFIRSGDVVTLAPLSGGVVRRGDVVAFADAAGALVVHRVVSRGAHGYQIRADGGGVADGLVPASSLLGVVTRVERGGRRVGAGLGPERGLIALLSRFGVLAPAVGAARGVRAWLPGRGAS